MLGSAKGSKYLSKLVYKQLDSPDVSIISPMRFSIIASIAAFATSCIASPINSTEQDLALSPLLEQNSTSSIFKVKAAACENLLCQSTAEATDFHLNATKHDAFSKWHKLKDYYHEKKEELELLAHILKIATVEDISVLVHKLADLTRRLEDLTDAELDKLRREWFEAFVDETPAVFKPSSETKRDVAESNDHHHHHFIHWVKDLYSAVHEKFHRFHKHVDDALKRDVIYLSKRFHLILRHLKELKKEHDIEKRGTFIIFFTSLNVILSIAGLVCLILFFPPAAPAIIGFFIIFEFLCLIFD